MVTESAVDLSSRPSSPSNTESVYAHLRELVLNGQIAPGSVLSQVKLASELGVSTTPLREAMRLLQAEGLLIAEHNRRSRVAPLDPRDIDAIYSSRIVIEALAMQLTVPGLTGDDYKALRALLRAMSEAAEAEDLNAWEPVHRIFHRRLVSGCDDAMMSLIEPLVDRCERYRRTSLYGSPVRTWEMGNDEHEAIVEACEARQAEAASLLLARHFARSALTILAKIAPEADPVAVRTALKIVQGAST